MRFSTLFALSLVIFHLFTSGLKGQAYNAAQGGASPVSAAALSYGKYADIPVNQYTGTGNVTVPLATVTDGPLSLPVYLQYHTGGLPVGTPAGLVGLGWNLFTGGMVSRTVRGIPDDTGNGYYYSGSTSNISDAEDAALGTEDSEPDVFVYNFPGYSGKFVFDKNQEVRTIPKADLEFEFEFELGRIFEIEITTPDGTKYFFGRSPDQNRAAFDYANIGGFVDVFTDRNGWHLIRMESHDGKHFINLSYKDFGYRYPAANFCPDRIKYLDGNNNVQDINNCSGLEFQENLIRSSLPTSITSTHQAITFIADGRTDLENYQNGSFEAEKITSVKYENGDYCVLYDFLQSAFLSTIPLGEERLRLDGVQKTECGNGSVSEPAWTFNYHNDLDFFPAMDDKNIDHWGFYNYDPSEGDNGDDMVPPTLVQMGLSSISHGNANRESNEAAMLNGMLTKVNYPTGGHLAIEYEANVEAEAQGAVQLIDAETCDFSFCDGNYYETVTQMLSQYDIDNGFWELCIIPEAVEGQFSDNLARVRVLNSSGEIVSSLELNNFEEHCVSGTLPDVGTGSPLVAGQAYTFEVFSSNANATFTLSGSLAPIDNIVGGLRIKKTMVHDGLDTSKDIITDYGYTLAGSNISSGQLYREPAYGIRLNQHTALFSSFNVAPLTGFGGHHIGYERVVTSQAGNGSTETLFHLETAPGVNESNIYEIFPIAPVKYKAEAGNPVSASVKDESGQEVSSSTNIRFTGDSYEIIGESSGNGTFYTARAVPVFNGSSQEVIYPYNTYQLRTGTYRPGSVSTTVDGITTTTDYDYHPNNLLADEIEVTNSDNHLYRTDITYVTDYDNVAMRNEMRDRNMKVQVQKIRKFHNGKEIDGSLTDYRFFDDNGNNPTLSPGGTQHPRVWREQRYVRTTAANGALLSGAYETQLTYSEYSRDGLLEKYYEPNWATTVITYDDEKLPESKEFSGHTTYYNYETGSSMLESIIAVDGTETRYTYDGLMRLETTRNVCKDIDVTYDYHFTTGPGDLNYTSVTTDFPTVPGATSQVDITASKTFKDGLGRNIQTIGLNLGPNNNEDIISSVRYDKYGRVEKTYEPRAYSNNNGTYQAPATSWEQTTTAYYPSPLNRKLSVTPPNWATTTYSYGTNETSDNIGIAGLTHNQLSYAEGTLGKATVTDGNGNKLIVFTDKIGRKILSRRTNQADDAAKRLDTRYVYDRKSRIAKVLPPGSTLGTTSLQYTYLYDGEDKLLEKKIPGKDKIEYAYNNRDLLAAERDGYLRGEGKWFSYSYDLYGRTEESGFYDNASLPGTIIDLAPTTPLLKAMYGAGHEKDKVKTMETRIMDGGNDWLTTTNNYSTCGLLLDQTGNNHLNVTPTTSETTTYTYDGADNPTGSTYLHQLPTSTLPITSQAHYDHAGRNVKNYFRVNTGINTQLNRLEYDAKGQLTTKYQGETGLPDALNFLQKTDYGYLPNGMLKGINLSSDGLSGTQTGLPGHNQAATAVAPGGVDAINADDKDLFYLELYRRNGANMAVVDEVDDRHNGDITHIATQVRGRDQHLFALEYDEYDRMTAARFFERDDPTDQARPNDAYSEELTYDTRGNIMTLDRRGSYRSGGNWLKTDLDDLNYTYFIARNRLKSIAEDGDDNRGYIYGSGQFTYDANGNTTYDPSRGVTVTYNHLDLPEKIEWLALGQQRIELTYDATGTLLTRKHFNQTGTRIEKRDYVGGIEYLNDNLESVAHAEGRVYMGGVGQRFDYAITDHLGNTRLLYSDLNNDGIPQVPDEIIQEHHYYPFGMKMSGPWMSSASTADQTKYQYNGIEHVDAFDLNVNMAVYRTLDPTTGRWWSVDPKAEGAMGHSPYNSMWNSPMVYSDPDGDFAFLAFAAVGVATNGIINSAKGDSFFQGWAGAAIGGALSGGYLGAVGSAVSSHLPSANIALGGGFSLSISPAIAFGSNGFSIGANAGLSYSSNGFSAGIGAGIGYTNMSLGANSAKGFTSSIGGGFSVGNSDWNAGFYTNATSGAGIGQRVAGFRANLKGGSVAYENDDAPFDLLGGAGNALKDGGDRFRSNAVSVGYAGVDLRLNMFTGDPTGVPTDPSPGYPQGYHTGKADMYRLGALSLGYNGYRAGWNSEGIRNKFQNEFAHQKVRPQPYFRRLPSGYPGSFYSEVSSFQNPYSLWSF